MKTDRIDRIQRTSRKFYLLFSVLLVLVPLSHAFYWLCFNMMPEGFLIELPVKVSQNLPLTTLLLALLVNCIPLSLVLAGILALRKLFGLYRQAIIFSADNVRCFRHLGYALLGWVPAQLLYTGLVSAILTWGNPEGQRAIVLQFGSPNLTALIAGAMIIVIARIMDEARILEDEQIHTV